MKDILLKYNRPVPRYTSYPPANFFKEGINAEQYIQLLQQSNNDGEQNISVYLHTPFCKQKCHFCGCNSLIWNNDEQTERYISALIVEIKRVFSYIDTQNRKISQIHWGGGTPNNLSIDQHRRVMAAVLNCAQLTSKAEVAIECNPAYLDEQYIKGLSQLGFNRISLGIQDLNPIVLKAINREPSFLPIEKLIEIIRNNGFNGINLDFVYGLPFQNVEQFKETIAAAIRLRPNRIVTFSYAHMPSLMSGQSKIDATALPSDNDKLEMYIATRKLLVDAGYDVIGFDHFALPDDELSKAKQQKVLHRNFQGYCTRETTGQVYAFGASGITQLKHAFIQNVKTTQEYIKSIESGGFAVNKAYVLSSQDMLCSQIIEAIMCNGFVDLEEVALQHQLSIEAVFEQTGFKPEKLRLLVDDGLVKYYKNQVVVSEMGMTVVRNIAMLFDPLIQNNSAVHSKTI